jgi:hypothetical protein
MIKEEIVLVPGTIAMFGCCLIMIILPPCGSWR